MQGGGPESRKARFWSIGQSVFYQGQQFGQRIGELDPDCPGDVDAENHLQLELQQVQVHRRQIQLRQRRGKRRPGGQAQKSR